MNEVSLPELATQLVSLLARTGLSIATAESCTGGMAAQYITAVPGASAVFECGVVAYANRIKTQLLSVSPDTLARVGAVSRETAAEMARGVRVMAGSRIGVATTGIAGPSGGTAEKPVGTVYIALSSGQAEHCVKLSLGEACGGDREKIRQETVRQLFLLAIRTLKDE